MVQNQRVWQTHRPRHIDSQYWRRDDRNRDQSCFAFSYGYDRVRFIRPVFIGDTIHVRLTVKDKRDYPKRTTHGVLVDLIEVINQHDQVVLACEHLSMVERKTPQTT